MDQTPNAAERLGHLEGRVGGLEGNLRELKELVTTGLGSLSNDLKTRSQPQYALQIGLAGLMFTGLAFVGSSWKAPIETALAQQSTDIHRMQGDYVPRWMHEREWARGEKEAETVGRRLDRLEMDRFKGKG